MLICYISTFNIHVQMAFYVRPPRILAILWKVTFQRKYLFVHQPVVYRQMKKVNMLVQCSGLLKQVQLYIISMMHLCLYTVFIMYQ